MATPDPGATPMSIGDLTERVTRDIATLDGELAEIDMLIAQARVEAERHELKRVQTTEKLAGMPPSTPAEDSLAISSQLVTLTRRAAVMEAQVEVLEGKRKVLARFREGLAGVATGLGAAEVGGDAEGASAGATEGARRGSGGDGQTAGLSRIVLSAQEDLRREIARAMHDGPAQSLTNIVLQAQIVDRLLAGDPEQARNEVRQLVSMVQQTLDATKSFIFDVRPMVLDDLGLVPTLRRAARERGRRSGVPVEFDSMGTDRRLSMDLESGLFRIIDEAMDGFLSLAPDRVAVRLDWTAERVEGHVSATRDRSSAIAEAEEVAAEQAGRPAAADTPPALAAMMADRRDQAEAAAEAARTAAIVSLPANAWREIQQRATTIGIAVELVGGGGELQLAVDVPPDAQG